MTALRSVLSSPVLFVAVLSVAVLPVAAPLVAAEPEAAPSATAEERRRQRLREELSASADWNQFLLTQAPDAKVEPVRVHRWTNDERDPQGEGIAVLWIGRGRPVAAASIYPWNGRLAHELESLSRETFVCRRDGAAMWTPQTGIEFTRVADAEPPAESPAARLRQMKGIADRFTITMLGWKEDDSDREQLRRLPKEFFRYRPEAAGLLDGAVFAFVKGTDPEALFLVEAVAGEAGGASEWHYAIVRQTSGGVEARLGEQVVWTAPKHVFRRDPTKTFFSADGPLAPSAVEISPEEPKAVPAPSQDVPK